MKRKSRIKKVETRKRGKKYLFHDILVSVATVVHNDADIIEQYVLELSKVLQEKCAFYEIVIVDNNSTDATQRILMNLEKRIPNIRVLILSRRYEQGVGFVAALENSIGDFVVLLDIVTDPVTLIPKLITTARRGNDIVLVRPKTHTLMMFSSAFYRVFSRTVVTALIKDRRRNGYTPYSKILPGFTQTSLEYTPIARRRESFTHGLFPLKAALKMLISSAPMLRIATYLGVMATVLNLVALLYMSIQVIIYHADATQLLTTAMFLVLFMMLTVIAFHLGWALNSPREQQLYHIVEEVNSSVIAETDAVNVV